MTFTLLLTALLVKHALLAHVFDSGYTNSRRVTNRLWYVSLVGNLVTELGVTYMVVLAGNALLRTHPEECVFLPSHIAVAMSLEAGALALGCLIERRAPLWRLLYYHVLAEILTANVYLVVTFFLLQW